MDYQIAKIKIFRALVDNGNPKTNMFVNVFCYINDLHEDKVVYFLYSEGKFDIVHLIFCFFSSN